MEQKEEVKKTFVLIEHAKDSWGVIEALNGAEEKSISIPAQIRQQTKFGITDKLHIIFQFIEGYISALCTKDPTKVHFDIVRATLKDIDKDLIDNTYIIDMMARQLISHCIKLKNKIKVPDLLKKQSNHQEKDIKFDPSSGRTPLPLQIIEIEDSDELSLSFEEDNMFIWDKALLEIIRLTGTHGSKASKDYKKILINRLESCKKKEENPLNFWFNFNNPTPEEPFHTSPALRALSHHIFEDIVQRYHNLEKNHVAALTTPIQKDIEIMLSPSNKIEKSEQHFYITHQENVIATSMPAISPKMAEIIFKGASKLNTVTGHRLVRHFPQEAFNSMTLGEKDYRVIRFERGATEIAEKLGLHGKQHISNIKEIIHAMAYFEFSQETFSGNLIQLSKHKSRITNREEAYTITVGTPLLPYQTFKDNGLLIPLMGDPPLVSPNQYHAHQYLLQMKIMGVFSNQSIDLVDRGYVEISEYAWQEIALSCGIHKDLLKKILARWIRDGDDAPKLLEHVEDNYYTLGKEHEKAHNFLVRQGEIRKIQSQKGKISAQRKKLKK